MDDSGVADAFYTVLSIGIVLVAAIAVSGVVLSATMKQGGQASAEIAGGSGMEKGLYCFFYTVDTARSKVDSSNSDDIVLQGMALERADQTVALNASSIPASAPATNGMALWSGYLYVPSDSTYTLELSSAGPSWLWVDGNMAIANPGAHGTHAKSSGLKLAKGYHPVKLKYFYADARTASSSLSWKQGGKSAPINTFYR
jgi:hypothetical protein